MNADLSPSASSIIRALQQENKMLKVERDQALAERDRLREALTTIAAMRQEADEWEHPDFDWRILALKQEHVARVALGLPRK